MNPRNPATALALRLSHPRSAAHRWLRSAGAGNICGSAISGEPGARLEFLMEREARKRAATGLPVRQGEQRRRCGGGGMHMTCMRWARSRRHGAERKHLARRCVLATTPGTLAAASSLANHLRAPGRTPDP